MKERGTNMLLQEKMKQNIFSYNEQTIIHFILEKQEQIKNYSTKMIGDETYTAPSTVIRIAHKLGFQGWSDFKEAFLDEVIYLKLLFCKWVVSSNLLQAVL